MTPPPTNDAASGGDEEERRLWEETARLGELTRELQESASALISRTWTEEQGLRQRALALESDLKRAQSAVSAARRRSSAVDPKALEKINEELYRAWCLIKEGDVASILPNKDHGRFLEMFLGPVNVRATRKEVRLKVKEEYNSYKDRTAFLFLLFPSILLILRSRIWDGCMPALPVQLYQAWLLLLYTSLALRENILRVNGSDIRPCLILSFFSLNLLLDSSNNLIKLPHGRTFMEIFFLTRMTHVMGRQMIASFIVDGLMVILITGNKWIYHHYCAMLMALVSLTWEIKGQPDCANKQKGVQLFLVWAIMQGVAMLLQNRYQRQRLYTRIALGKAKRMDVVWGETAGVEGQLLLLCPILFTLQVFEAYVGMLLLRTAVVGVVSEWQVIVCGILLVLMAVGNFANTVQTLMAKSRFKAKMKSSKSKNDLNQSQSLTHTS